MKIYPSKHKIKSIPTSKIDTDLNIPLAYIDVDYAKYTIDKIIDPKFSVNEKTILYPEQEFDNKDFILFNEFEEVVDKNNLFITSNNKYKFYPSNTIKFIPKKFLWKATVKKNFTYSISNTYDIKIGYMYNETLNRNLISTFMNPSERDMLVYSNIKINGNNKQYDTFDTNDPDTDFMFIKTYNCKNYNNNTGYVDVLIDYEYFLSNHINLWLGCEDAVALNESYKMLAATQDHIFKIKNPIVSDNASVASSHYFDLSTVSTPTGVTLHNIFDTDLVPALILEYENAGFIIITSYEILDNPAEYESFMYELMMYVYLRTYLSTDYIEEWITYDMPNFEVNNGVYTTKTNFTSKSSIVSLLKLNGSYDLVALDLKDDNSVRTLTTNKDYDDTTGAIKCIGQNNGKPIFVIDGVLDGYTEPAKPAGWKSIYSNGYMYYIEKLYYLIEQDITNKIMMIENDTDLIVKIFNFKSSSLNINKRSDTNLKISFIKTDGELAQRIREAEYTIYYIRATDKISFCFAEDYKESTDTYKLFNILVQQTDDAIQIYDMRQLGGGLAEEEPDDYELVDIGHINGRPYRVAGALVVTMPTKYKPYEDLIIKALDKYKTAEDYVAVFFEDKEDDDN